MIDTFITSFKLKNTYRVNSIIYSIKGLPIIKNILPYSLYKDNELKAFGNIVSGLIELITTFSGKFFYMFFMIFLMSLVYETNQVNSFLHIFTFLTMIGGIMNTDMFDATKDKYYAIVIMNMNANKYAVSNYYYYILRIIVGFLPFTIMFGLMAKVPLWLCIIMPIFVAMIKMIAINYNIHYFEKKGKANIRSEETAIILIFITILTAISYGLPFIGITITQNIFMALFILSLAFGIASFIKISKFEDYKKMYKQLLTIENVYQVENQNNSKTIKKNAENQIEYDDKATTSNKTGFTYFHELFVKRHSKILTKAVKKQAIIISLVFVIAILSITFNQEIAKNINNMTLTYLPYFVFVMYLLNRGTVVTQAMFMNCDHSMLTYRIYRTPKVILGIFKERLKTLIIINLLPAVIIGLGLPLLLYITGGTDNILNYFVLFISIISMSIFFSVHYLVMYYLLQPYNVNTEQKNSTYAVVKSLTYVVCYTMIEFRLPTFSFGIATIIFSVLYCLISLILAYRLAPKTFKLRT